MDYIRLIDWVILAALIFTIFALLRVSRSLKVARKIHKALKVDLQLFTDSSDKAQDALVSLERTRAEMTKAATKEKRDIEHLREDMVYLIEQGKNVADRLEGALHALRPVEKAARESPKVKKYSKAERDALIKSLDNLR